MYARTSAVLGAPAPCETRVPLRAHRPRPTVLVRRCAPSLLRARIANPPLRSQQPGKAVERALIDGDFVTVSVEGIQPIMALGIPRKAVLSDQQGNYVYVVGDDKKAEQRRIQLGQSTPTTAVIATGLKEGELVIVDGIQRVRPGIEVSPGPASPPPAPPAAGH